MNLASPVPFEILIAEDDADDRLLASDAFAEMHQTHRLNFVENGLDLVHYLKGEGDYKDTPRALPDLILLDLNMPKMNGIEALNKIKGDSKLRTIPVVILTTSSREEDVVTCYSLGAASFHTKPESYFDLVALFSVLGRYWIDFAVLPVE